MSKETVLQVAVYFFLIEAALIFPYVIISEGLFILAKYRMWVRWSCNESGTRTTTRILQIFL